MNRRRHRLKRVRPLRPRFFLPVLILLLPHAMCSHRKPRAGVVPSEAADPRPIDAEEAILEAFDEFPVVAVSEMHALNEEHDFFQSLLRNPALPDKVDAIVMEAGNARYQEVLDRFIAGEQVPMAEVRQVWRNTVASPHAPWDAQVFEQFYTTVREVNRALPEHKRLRVLAGDPPIDWSSVQSSEDILPFLGDRDRHFASVVENEVLARKQKALLIIGGMHILKRTGESRGGGNVTQRIEARRPGSVFVVYVHFGLIGAEMDREYLGAGARTRRNASFESTESFEERLASWPVPSIARVKNTWLGGLRLSLLLPGGFGFDGRYKSPESVVGGMSVADAIDAYLYVGPKESLTFSKAAPSVRQDKAYQEELNRRSVVRSR